MRELPPRLAHHLEESGRHPLQEIPQAEVTAEGLGLLEICGLRRPSAPHQEVEGEGLREDVVLVELGGGRHPAPPALRPQGRSVEALQEEEPRLGQAQADEEGGEGRLAAAGRTFQQEPLARVDSQADALEDGSATVAVAKHQVVRLEHGLVVP